MEFVCALKSTWIRRLIHSNTKWVKLFESELGLKIETLWEKGSDFITNISNKIRNKFWKEDLLDWVKIVMSYSQNDIKVLNEHIWFNPNIKINNSSIFIKNYFNCGYKFIKDLMTEEGNFVSLETLENSNVKTNFLEYRSLKGAVFERLKALNNNKVEYGPFIPNSLSIFYKQSKGCKDMYYVLIDNKKESIRSVKKWTESGFAFTEIEWNNIFELPFKTSKESKFQWLQFQILHRMLPTNEYLFKLNIIDSPACSFCNQDIETIEHLFVDCFHVKEIWLYFEEWLRRKFNFLMTFDKKTILFGKFKNRNMYRLQNILILTVKQFIFASKYKNVPNLSTLMLKQTVTDRIHIEKLLLLKNCKFAEYEKYWQTICDLL